MAVISCYAAGKPFISMQPARQASAEMEVRTFNASREMTAAQPARVSAPYNAMMEHYARYTADFCRCHMKMTPHENTARGHIITELICLSLIKISPAP